MITHRASLPRLESGIPSIFQVKRIRRLALSISRTLRRTENDSSVVEKGSVYVCFMGGGTVDEHCALLIASENGGFYMADNSSGNWGKNGGVNVDYATSLAGVERAYRSNYSKFYYQKVTKL